MMNADKERTLDTSKCIRCGKCRDGCTFLTKYNLLIGDEDQLRDVAYHCFLCGRCTRVCPVNIDGRQIFMNLREDIAAQEEKRIIKEHRALVWEKNHYKYRNYKNAESKQGNVHSVYFPGCNFPSLFPKTNALLSKILYDEAGIGTAYDCCGKPIAELGLEKDARRIAREITENLQKVGVDEIVTACPNCFYHLTPRSALKITSIYDKLTELGIGGQIDRDLHFYVPCPDRDSHAWVRSITRFVKGKIIIEDEPQCCGLGGSGGACEPELAKAMASAFNGRDGGIDTGCASCTGSFTRAGGELHHILPEILGIEESPDVARSYMNRVRTKWKR